MVLQLRISTIHRAPAGADEAEGEALVGAVRAGMGRGRRDAVGVVVRRERTELVELGPAIAAGVPLHTFLAALSRSRPEGQSEPLAVGVGGRFLYRPERGGAPVAVGLAFLEWPDNRWWQWRSTLDAEGSLVADSEIVRRAVDGDALPTGLGRWWSLGRRTGASIRYGTPTPAAPAAHGMATTGGTLVH